MKNNILITILVGVACLGLGYLGGKTVGNEGGFGSKNITGNNSGVRLENGQGSIRMGQAGGSVNMTRGEVVELDDNSMVVKMADGSSKIIFLSSNTRVNKSTEIGKEEIINGDTVSVFGTKNDDGSIMATDIQIGQLVGGMGQRPEGNTENLPEKNINE